MSKTVLVTGSAKGIGKELIIEYSKLGYNVIINYNNSEKEAKELSDFISNNYNNKVLAIKCDITKEEDIKEMKDIIINEYKNIDILINNAALSIDNYLVDKTKEEFMKVLEVNVVGTFLMTKYFSDIVNEVICNISSTDAVDTYNDISIDYCASKAAINSLTKTLAMALKNIKVIAVMPNWTNTESIKEMNPEFLENELKRTGQKTLSDPNDVAKNIIDVINSDIKTGSIMKV